MGWCVVPENTTWWQHYAALHSSSRLVWMLRVRHEEVDMHTPNVFNLFITLLNNTQGHRNRLVLLHIFISGEFIEADDVMRWRWQKMLLVCLWFQFYLFFTSRIATSTSRMNTSTAALMPAIFTTWSVCLAGSGITSGSSVAPEHTNVHFLMRRSLSCVCACVCQTALYYIYK